MTAQELGESRNRAFREKIFLKKFDNGIIEKNAVKNDYISKHTMKNQDFCFYFGREFKSK